MMESLRRADDEQATVREAALQVMLALSDLLSEANMGTIGEITALAKLALVQGAMRRAQAAGAAPPTVSEIAVETGISRNDVPKLMQAKASRPPAFQDGRSRAETVLAGWWNDPEFHEFGRPAALDGPGLAKLIERHGVGTQRVKPIVNELLRAGAIKRLKDGRLKAIKPTCVNVRWDRQSIRNVGEAIARHFGALLHNLTKPTEPPLFVRSIEGGPIDPSFAKLLQRDFVRDLGVLLDGAAHTLARKRYAARPQERNSRRVIIAAHILDEAFEGMQRTASPSRRGSRSSPKRRGRKRRAVPGGEEVT